jgi:hypothetical protein
MVPGTYREVPGTSRYVPGTQLDSCSYLTVPGTLQEVPGTSRYVPGTVSKAEARLQVAKVPSTTNLGYRPWS